MSSDVHVSLQWEFFFEKFSLPALLLRNFGQAFLISGNLLDLPTKQTKEFKLPCKCNRIHWAFLVTACVRYQRKWLKVSRFIGPPTLAPYKPPT